jgi:hypothetical protein
VVRSLLGIGSTHHTLQLHPAGCILFRKPSVLLVQFAAMGREKIGPIERLRCKLTMFPKPEMEILVDKRLLRAARRHSS